MFLRENPMRNDVTNWSEAESAVQRYRQSCFDKEQLNEMSIDDIVNQLGSLGDLLDCIKAIADEQPAQNQFGMEDVDAKAEFFEQVTSLGGLETSYPDAQLTRIAQQLAGKKLKRATLSETKQALADLTEEAKKNSERTDKLSKENERLQLEDGTLEKYCRALDATA